MLCVIPDARISQLLFFTFSASIKTRLSSILIDKKIDFSNVELKTFEKGEVCTDESSVGIKELKHFSVVKMSVKRATTSKKDVK